MKLYTCPICGGRLKIKIDTGVAVCDSCGEMTPADDAELRRLREINDNAERLIRQNSSAGYREAIRLLESISFAADVDEKCAYCRARLNELQGRQQRQQTLSKDSGKRETATGIVLMILILLFLLAVVAGAIVLFVLWSKGKLPPQTVTVAVCVIAVLAVLAILGKVKSGN